MFYNISSLRHIFFQYNASEIFIPLYGIAKIAWLVWESFVQVLKALIKALIFLIASTADIMEVENGPVKHHTREKLRQKIHNQPYDKGSKNTRRNSVSGRGRHKKCMPDIDNGLHVKVRFIFLHGKNTAFLSGISYNLFWCNRLHY